MNAAGLEGLGKKSASTVEVSSPSAMTKGSRDIETFRGGQNGKGEFAFRLHPPPLYLGFRARATNALLAS